MKIKSRKGAQRFQSTNYRTGNRRGGSVIVIVALSMVALCGFGALAVDYGVLVSDANRLQRAADSGALAGAAQLKKTGFDATDTANARLVASSVVAQNGIANFDSSTITFNATSDRITVPTTTRRNFFFAPVFRLIDSNSATSGQVSRRATAGRTSLKGVPAVAPLAITITDYQRYKDGSLFENILIDNNRQSFIDGTVTALDLRLDNSGKSGVIFENDVTYGTNRTTIIGEQINSALNASLNSQGAKLESAIDARISMAAAAPYYDNGNNYSYPDYPANDPRIMTIMVANPNNVNNSNPMLTALFFVSVYIDRIRSPGSSGTHLRLRIMPPVNFSSDRSDIVVGDDTTLTGGPAVIGLID